jgi:hypothetical protein
MEHSLGVGKVIVKIKLTNLFDQAFFSRGLAKRKPRSVVVKALVDTGATRLVDSKGQKLMANPAHGGEQMTEEY